MKNNVYYTSVDPNIDSIKNAFIDWFNNRFADFDCPKLEEHEVYIVWFCYIVGNAKMLISTTRPDHMYYEVTYHGEKKQLHIDAYKKFTHESLGFVKSKSSKDGSKSQDKTEIFNEIVNSIFDSFI